MHLDRLVKGVFFRSGESSIPVIQLLAVFALTASTAGADRLSQSLDGRWEFRFAPDSRGLKEGWFAAETVYERAIEVPGCWDAQGVGEPTDKMRHNAIGTGWYRRTFAVPQAWEGKRVWLVVGGAHRTAKVWVNGQFVGEHIGYPVAFRFDITDKLRSGRQELVIAVDNRQDWNRDPLVGTFDVIDFMDLTWGGIQEHVKLEATGEAWIDDAFVQPDPAGRRAELELSLGGVEGGGTVSYRVRTADKPVLAQGEAKLTSQNVRLALDLPDAPLWTPEHPSLLTLELALTRNGQTLDTREVRFGLRRLEARDGHFLLNGAPFFLRGYGDDYNFPRELVPPASVAFWKDYLQKRRDFGFNGVRHHSLMPVESYLRAADEVGMLVQPELPIAYYEHLKRAKPETHEAYKRVWRDYIRQMRNHPSVMAWCMGNEMWNGIPFGPELYKMAKELDPTRPVIDGDGVRPDVNRPTLDYRPVQFDEWKLPWGATRDKYAAKNLGKPVIVHEMGNISCLPDPAEAKECSGAIRPFWLEQMDEAVKKQGLERLLPRMLKASWQLQASLLKLNIEAARLGPGIDGYDQWLFRDYWTQSSGIESILGHTRALSQAMTRQFNSDAVLLWDRERVNFHAGETIPLSLVLSDFRPTNALRIAKVAVRLGEAATELRAPANVGGRAAVGPWTGEMLTPAVRSPKRLTLVAEAAGVRNEWPVWIWPPAPEPGNQALVASRLTQEVLKKLETGANVLLTDEQLAFPTQNASFKPAWWKGDERNDFVHGNLFLDHPALKGFPHDGYGDLQTFELLNNRPVTKLDEMPGGIEPIVWALDVPWKMRRMGYLWEARVGKGKLLVSAFALRQPQRNTNPAAAWMYALLTRYASSPEFQPKVDLPVAWLRDRISTLALPEPAACVEGFNAVITSTAEKTRWQTYRGEDVPVYVVRNTDGAHRLTWKTAPLPLDWSGNNVTFVWAGGLGYRSQPGGGSFVLEMNGRKVCDIPFVSASAQWPCDLSATLRYQVCRTTDEDTFGLFCLSIPTAKVVPGQPVELTLTGTAEGSQRWISVSPYRDVVKSLRDE
jgi:hypothetical protein